jgi:mono/diheme cytochrome c family protein
MRDVLRWPGRLGSCPRPAMATRRRDSESAPGLRPLPHPWGKPNPSTPEAIFILSAPPTSREAVSLFGIAGYTQSAETSFGERDDGQPIGLTHCSRRVRASALSGVRF